MKLLFVADPLGHFKTYKDTTFSMMREAARRGHELLACEPRHISWKSGGKVAAACRQIELTAALDALIHHQEDHVLILDLGDADRVDLRVTSLGKGFAPVTREPLIV